MTRSLSAVGVTLACFLALLLVPKQTFAQDTYPVIWADVVTSEPATIVVANEDLGPCICDLTHDTCDVNCYCDTSCTDTEKERFSEALEEGPVEYTVDTCIDNDLVTLNARGGITADAFCVSKNNNPSTGYFFDNSETISSTVFGKLSAAVLYEYTEEETFRVTSGASYAVDDLIRAASTDDNGASLYRSNQGKFVIPGPGFTQNCETQGNSPRYLRASQETCTRPTVASLEEACVANSTVYSVSAYINQYVATRVESSPDVLSGYVAIEIAEGDLVYVTTQGSVSLNTDDVNGTVATTNVTVTTTNGTVIVVNIPVNSTYVPQPYYNATSCTCENVVQEVQYTFAYLPDGAIEKVFAYVAITTIEGTEDDLGSCAMPALVQTFGVDFNTTDGNGDTVGMGRPKSGNPGYLAGYPVLAGDLVTDTVDTTLTAIRQHVDGLTVFGPDSNGECGVSTTGSETVVNFQENMIVGCSVPMTLQELTDLCNSGSPVTYLPLDETLYFGQWGNSEHTNPYVWTQLTTETIAAASNWLVSSRECQGIIDTVKLEVVWANYGSMDNPQPAILEIRQSFSTTTWNFEGTNTTEAENFPIKATVTHLYYQENTLTEYIPPGAPVTIVLPADVLYPFQIASN